MYVTLVLPTGNTSFGEWELESRNTWPELSRALGRFHETILPCVLRGTTSTTSDGQVTTGSVSSPERQSPLGFQIQCKCTIKQSK